MTGDKCMTQELTTSNMSTPFRPYVGYQEFHYHADKEYGVNDVGPEECM